MATGDKIYIADKVTLDSVNTKVGSSGDTGATTTTGSLFAKINSLTSRVAAFVANWTEARAAKVDNLDAAVSSRQSEANAASRYNTLSTNTGVNNTASATGTLSQKLSHIINTVATRESDADATNRYYQLNTNTGVNNTASATGTLSQKLSHIINLFPSLTPKKLVSKAVNINIETAGTHTLVNVTGGGQFEFARTDMGDSANPITFEIDGNKIVLNTLYQGYTRSSAFVGQSAKSPGTLVYQSGAGAAVGDEGPFMRPIHFKNSLKITVTTLDTTKHSFGANYAVYE